MTNRDIAITIKLDVGNDDAVDFTTAYYVGKHVKQIGYHIMERQGDAIMNKGGKIRDDNGNTIGEWSIDGDLTYANDGPTERQLNEAWGV